MSSLYSGIRVVRWGSISRGFSPGNRSSSSVPSLVIAPYDYYIVIHGRNSWFRNTSLGTAFDKTNRPKQINWGIPSSHYDRWTTHFWMLWALEKLAMFLFHYDPISRNHPSGMTLDWVQTEPDEQNLLTYRLISTKSETHLRTRLIGLPKRSMVHAQPQHTIYASLYPTTSKY